MARQVSDPQVALRTARAIVSDIALYNPDKVEKGIKEDSIFDLLAQELQEGREHFYSRVTAQIEDPDALFDRAVVDVLIKRAGNIESPIW